MGYRLFIAGIWGNAGEFDAQFRDAKLVIRKAAPGVFFALFGTIIVAYTVFVGIKWESRATHTDGEVLNSDSQLYLSLRNHHFEERK